MEEAPRQCSWKIEWFDPVYKMVLVRSNEAITYEEAKAYCARGLSQYGDELAVVDCDIEENDYVSLHYLSNEHCDFERIRRITGYLVGTLNRFNDAKLAEVKDRVKHGLR